jgi:hypothetical protein
MVLQQLLPLAVMPQVRVLWFKPQVQQCLGFHLLVDLFQLGVEL